MKRRAIIRSLAAVASTVVVLGISACAEPTAGELPETKPATPESIKADQAKIDMMKGTMYKAGVPGTPGGPP